MSGDALFACLEQLQGDVPWGRVLDAGTGDGSLDWVAGLPTRSWTAVTGEAATARNLNAAFRPRARPADRVVHGNWTDPALLYGEVFDVVLADYLLGAIDGYAPYFQDRLFARLRPHVGGRLYVTGLAPYPQTAPHPWGEVLLEIARLRDACILLAGDRTYREYPVDWVVRSLEASGYAVEEVRRFPIRYGERFVGEQLSVAQRKLPRLADRGLAGELERAVADLRERALRRLAGGGDRVFGEDWVVYARPVRRG